MDLTLNTADCQSATFLSMFAVAWFIPSPSRSLPSTSTTKASFSQPTQSECNFKRVDLSASIKIIKMKGTSTNQQEQVYNPVVKKRKGLKLLILTVVLLVAGGVFAVWHFGAHQAHQKSIHPLFASFDDSPQHKKLLGQLQKGRLSVLSGKREDGLQQFVEHYANRLSQAGPVFIEDLDSEHFEYYQLVKDAKGKIDELLGEVLGDVAPTGDWILLSQGVAVVPEDLIKKITERNPKGRVLVVSSANQKIKGFKNFAFPKVEEQLLEKIIAKSLKVKPQVADILYDYFGSPEAAFLNLTNSFDQKALLGESHRPLEGLSKEDKAALQVLCTKGVGKAKKESPKLVELGVVYFDGNNHWQSIQSILNYELGTGVNCKNTVAPESILQSAESRRLKQAEERKKEEERKAEEARLQEQAKAKEEQARLESEKKKQEQEAAKAAKGKQAPKKEKKAKATEGKPAKGKK